MRGASGPSIKWLCQVQLALAGGASPGADAASWKPCSGQTFTARGLNDGTYTFYAQSQDARFYNLEYSKVVNATFTVDTAAPSTELTGASTPASTATASFNFSSNTSSSSSSKAPTLFQCSLSAVDLREPPLPILAVRSSPTGSSTGTGTGTGTGTVTDAGAGTGATTRAGAGTLMGVGTETGPSGPSDPPPPLSPLAPGLPSPPSDTVRRLTSLTPATLPHPSPLSPAAPSAPLPPANGSSPLSPTIFLQPIASPSGTLQSLTPQTPNSSHHAFPWDRRPPQSPPGGAEEASRPPPPAVPQWPSSVAPGGRLPRHNLVHTWQNCTSPMSYTGLYDGTYTFSVRAVDSAGNADPHPPRWSWTLDTILPGAAITRAPPRHTNDSVPEIEFSLTGRGGAGGVSGAAPNSSASASSASSSSGSPLWECTFRNLSSAGGIGILEFPAPESSAASPGPSGGQGGSSPAAPAADVAPGEWPPASSPAVAAAAAAPPADGTSNNNGSRFATDTSNLGPSAGAAAPGYIAPGLTEPEALAQFMHLYREWHACSSPFAAPSALPDGPYAFSVRAAPSWNFHNLDNATASHAFVIDTVPPLSVVLSTPPLYVSKSEEARIVFLSSEQTHTLCQVAATDEASQTHALRPWSPCQSPLGLNTLLLNNDTASPAAIAVASAAPEGAYTLTLRAFDLAGNEGFPLQVEFVYDHTPPSVEIVTTALTASEADELGIVSHSFSAAFIIDDSAELSGAAGYTCQLASSSSSLLLSSESFYMDRWRPCTSPAVYSGLFAGSYNFSVRAADFAGNEAVPPVNASFAVLPDGTYATTAADNPALTSLLTSLKSSLNSRRTNRNVVEMRFGPASSFGGSGGDEQQQQQQFNSSGELAYECHLSLEGGGILPPGDPAGGNGEGGPTTSDLTDKMSSCESPVVLGPLPDGAYVFHVRAVSGILIGPWTGASFLVDTKPPSTMLMGPPLLLNTLSPQMLLSGSDDKAGSGVVSFECQLAASGGAPQVDAPPLHKWRPCKPTTMYESLPTGLYTFSARALDAAGNADPNPPSLTFLVNAWMTAVSELAVVPPGEDPTANDWTSAGMPSVATCGDNCQITIGPTGAIISLAAGTATLVVHEAGVAEGAGEGGGLASVQPVVSLSSDRQLALLTAAAWAPPAAADNAKSVWERHVAVSEIVTLGFGTATGLLGQQAILALRYQAVALAATQSTRHNGTLKGGAPHQDEGFGVYSLSEALSLALGQVAQPRMVAGNLLILYSPDASAGPGSYWEELPPSNTWSDETSASTMVGREGSYVVARYISRTRAPELRPRSPPPPSEKLAPLPQPGLNAGKGGKSTGAMLAIVLPAVGGALLLVVLLGILALCMWRRRVGYRPRRRKSSRSFPQEVSGAQAAAAHARLSAAEEAARAVEQSGRGPARRRSSNFRMKPLPAFQREITIPDRLESETPPDTPTNGACSPSLQPMLP